FALEEIVPALEAVADADGLARVWQVAIGDDDRDQVFATLAGAYGRRGEKEQALAAVEAIPPGDGSFQTAALREVSMGLAAADRIDDALAVAPLVPSAAERAEALAATAWRLYEAGAERRALDVAQQAIAESERIED